MEYYVIDRIEGEWAVAERKNRTIKQIPLTELPPGIREGDVVVWEHGSYRIDKEETKRRRKAASELQNRLFKK